MLIISAKELHIVRMSLFTFPSWNMVCVNFASFTAYNLASDLLMWLFSPTVWDQNCSYCYLISLLSMWDGNSLIMFCTKFVISCSGSHAKTSYCWQLISDAVIVGLLHIRARNAVTLLMFLRVLVGAQFCVSYLCLFPYIPVHQ